MSARVDNRNSNPGLHLLYVKRACEHLIAIDKSIKSLEKFSNLMLMDITQAMYQEREKLVRQNLAYADAQEILVSIKATKIVYPKPEIHQVNPEE